MRFHCLFGFLYVAATGIYYKEVTRLIKDLLCRLYETVCGFTVFAKDVIKRSNDEKTTAQSERNQNFQFVVEKPSQLKSLFMKFAKSFVCRSLWNLLMQFMMWWVATTTFSPPIHSGPVYCTGNLRLGYARKGERRG
jgi:hypothetical protein